jgi:hypothetical protein
MDHGPTSRGDRRGGVGPPTLAVLTAVWESAGYPWSVRLQALLPAWMPWIRKRFHLRPEVERQLLKISPRQIGRRLQAARTQRRRRIYGRTKPGYLLKHQIPVKTDRWDVQSPGFTEVDLVSHSGNSASGEFAHTLKRDRHSYDLEGVPSRAGTRRRGRKTGSQRDRGSLALPLAGSGLGQRFGVHQLVSEALVRAEGHTADTGRPYKKDDNAHIEQKNWTNVRKLLGWERYDTPETVEAINDLYGHELRLWLNLFLPSVKLVKKVRMGSKVRRVYDRPRTPFERVRMCKTADREQVARLEELRKTLDSFQLASTIERKLEGIYRMANRRLSPRQVQETASNRRRTGGGKDARNRKAISTPTATATSLRLHCKCLDDHR